MWNKLKRLFSSTAFNIILIFALAGLVMWLTLRKDGDQVFAILKNVSVPMTLGIVALMVLGGFISSMADDAIQIRTDARLQDMFPSRQRATLISVSSFTFSVVMIILSPLAGYFFTVW